MYGKIFQEVVEEILTVHEMSTDELFGMTKKQSFANARHMLWHRLYDLGVPVGEIAAFMSEKSDKIVNTGVISHGLQTSRHKIITNPLYRNAFESLGEPI